MVYTLGTVPVLDYRVNAVPLDGDIAKIRAIDETPDGGVRFKGLSSGRPCHTEHFPTRMEWQGPPNSIGDFSSANLLNVSIEARALIEKFEPGVHQFIPIEFVDQRGNLLEARFSWVICNRLDSVDRENTTFILMAGKMWRQIDNVARSFPEYLPADVDTSAESKLVFNDSQIGGAHVWRDKHIDTGGPFLSDEFYQALLQSDLNGFNRQSHLRDTV